MQTTDQQQMTSLLESYPVVLTIPVAWGDMNAALHVSNTVYFKYFESARIYYFEHFQFEKKDFDYILASVSCKFILPITYPDTVSVGSKIIDIKEDRFIMEYKLVSHQLNQLAAIGESVIVTYDYTKNKKTKTPAFVVDEIKMLEKA
ncbi:MAG: acyl-CoA thioesterase [Candidatus Magnetomorum sp.]|nr:acyl-CoA thioesterase [Candidatus Magnetomorum sp.]